MNRLERILRRCNPARDRGTTVGSSARQLKRMHGLWDATSFDGSVLPKLRNDQPVVFRTERRNRGYTGTSAATIRIASTSDSTGKVGSIAATGPG